MELKTVLQEKLNFAYEGRNLWIELMKNVNFGVNDYVILMPSDDKEVNYYTLLYLNQFAEVKNVEKIYLVTFDKNIMKSYSLFINKPTQCINLSRENIEKLMNFYNLYMFTDKLIIASLDELKGRTAKNLVDKKGITLEEIISIGILQNRKFIKEDPITYTGNDKFTDLFLNL
ncbi:hypothetical protein [Robertmurraya massiliosenegalensis]|uniref:hypothetical protein n=1 Tax=Robertmurraya massiliosenegalensis TaxID=1287657 RepID=UPI0002FD357E|nr:hypothetical protein [Robertmurraya massiliosenegalensis]